jgi:hypothetical protein
VNTGEVPIERSRSQPSTPKMAGVTASSKAAAAASPKPSFNSRSSACCIDVDL